MKPELRIAIISSMPKGHDLRVSKSKDSEKFKNLLLDSEIAQLETKVFEVEDGALHEALEYSSKILITGSPAGVYDREDWIDELRELIRKAYRVGGLLVGICFGHQLLADALGGEAKKSERGWGLGGREAEVLLETAWTDPFRKRLCLHYSHQDQVTKLPPGARLLAKCNFCDNAMFELGPSDAGSGKVLGIQGHPEYKVSHMQDLISHLESRVGPAMATAAKESLAEGETDSEVVRDWIVRFFLEC